MENTIFWPKRSHGLAVLGLLGLNLSLFGDVLWSSTKILSSAQADIYLHFSAWREFGFDQMRKGHLPLWNPHYLCGNPFLGNFESALLYPLNWFYLCMPLVLALNFGIVLHVFLAGFFTYLWVAHRGVHPLAAFLSGVVFMWGGAYYLHLYAGHLPNLCAMVWAPLIFLALDGFLDRQNGLWILLGVFAVSMQILAGHPQYVYFTAIAATLYLALHFVNHHKKMKIVGAFLAFYIGASLITAVQLWTGIESFWDSARHSSLNFASASSFSFPPLNLLTLFLPNFFGNLQSKPYWGSWYLWEVSLFMGMTSFVLVLCAIIRVKPQERHWALTMVVATLGLAFGAYTPLYSFFYRWIPMFNGMRGMSKFAFLSSLFLAMLSGMGLNDLIVNSQNYRNWVGPLVGAGFLLMGLGGWVDVTARNGIDGMWGYGFTRLPWLVHSLKTMDLKLENAFVSQAGIQAGLSLIGAGVVCLILSVLYFWSARWRMAVYGIVFLAVFQLFVFAHANRPSFEFSALQKENSRITQFYSQHPGDYRVYGTGAKALVTKGQDIWEDEPMVPSRYAQFVCYSQGIPENQLFSVSPVITKIGKVFGLIRLKYILNDTRQGLEVYKLPFPIMPRMSLIYDWKIESDSLTELKTITSNQFDPFQQVLLETNPNILHSLHPGRGKIQWRDKSTDEIVVQAKTTSPCILLVTDNYSPGWKAEALPDSSQKTYRVLPGDYFLRAIPLNAGYHHFVLQYQPWAFEIGKWVSLVSCLLYLVILFDLGKRQDILGIKKHI